jgi:hypothetical protein
LINLETEKEFDMYKLMSALLLSVTPVWAAGQWPGGYNFPADSAIPSVLSPEPVPVEKKVHPNLHQVIGSWEAFQTIPLGADNPGYAISTQLSLPDDKTAGIMISCEIASAGVKYQFTAWEAFEDPRMGYWTNHINVVFDGQNIPLSGKTRTLEGNNEWWESSTFDRGQLLRLKGMRSWIEIEPGDNGRINHVGRTFNPQETSKAIETLMTACEN